MTEHDKSSSCRGVSIPSGRKGRVRHRVTQYEAYAFVLVIAAMLGPYSRIGVVRIDYLVIALGALSLCRRMQLSVTGLVLVCLMVAGALIQELTGNPPSGTHSWVQSLQYAAYWFIDVLLLEETRALVRRPDGSAGIARALVVVLVANVALGIGETLTGWHLPLGDPSRYTSHFLSVPVGFFFNTNSLAVFLASIGPLVIAMKSRVFWSAMVIVSCGGLLIASGSRTGFATFGIGLVVLLIRSAWTARGFGQRAMSIVGLVVEMGLVLGSLSAWFVSGLAASVKLVSSGWSVGSLFASSRATLFSAYSRILADRPLGYGFSASALWTDANVSSMQSLLVVVTNPHNFLLELVLVFGVPLGTLGYLHLVATAFKTAVRGMRVDGPYGGAVAWAALLMLLVGQAGVSTVSTGFAYFWILLGWSFGVRDRLRMAHSVIPNGLATVEPDGRRFRTPTSVGQGAPRD
jgi:hypothetical protein